MKKTNKKGFTIVELVIVIAVIAILAAVLIPNISRLVKKANESVDIQLVRNLNTALQLDRAGTKTYPTMHDALDAVKEAGYDVAKLAKSDTENVILWDSVNQCFALLVNGEGEPVYYPDTKTTEPENYQLWRVYDEMPAEQTYSIYWIGESLTKVTVKGVGFDAGDKDVAAVKYEGLAGENPERKVVIRTNSYSTKVTVDAENDSVSHYDMAGDVEILNVKGSSYHEFGKVKTVTIMNGHFVAEAGCELGSDVVSNGTATVDNKKAAIWGTPEYKWSEDYSTCTATRKDKNGVKADETETVQTTKETVDGKDIYTAVFKNPAFATATKEVTLPTEEELLVDAMNQAIDGYTGESIMKALVYMTEKGKTVTVANLVHSDSTKTFAYDTTAHQFYIVNTADGVVQYPADTTASGDLVYVVNDCNTISSNMTRIYFNDYSNKDYALRQSDISALKQTLIGVEISGNVRYIYTELTSSAKKTNGEKSIEEQALLPYGSFDSQKGCFRDFITLESVLIGNSIKYIGRDAFYGCKKINYIYYNTATENMVYLYDDPKAVKDTPFENMGSQSIALVFGRDVKVIPCLFGCDNNDGSVVKTIEFETGIRYTKIGYYAFKGMSCLTEITLPDSCTIIQGSGASSAFAQTALKKVIWSGSDITVNDVLYNSKNNLGHGSSEDLIRFFRASIARIVGDNAERSLVVGEYTYVAGEFSSVSGTVTVYKNGELQYIAKLSDDVWTKVTD